MQKITEKSFFYGEETEYFKRTGYDIFYKENKDVIYNIFIATQQEKEKNNFFMEDVVSITNENNEPEFKNWTEYFNYYDKNGDINPNLKIKIQIIQNIFSDIQIISTTLKNILQNILQNLNIKNYASIPSQINSDRDKLQKSIGNIVQNVEELFKDSEFFKDIKDRIDKSYQNIVTSINEKISDICVNNEGHRSASG